MKPDYLKKITTGECFAYSEWLDARGDMVAWTGPLPWENKPAPKPAITIPEPQAEPEDAQAPEKAEEPEPSPFQCSQCEFVGKNAGALRLHQRKHL